MADNSLPVEGLSSGTKPGTQARRAFLRRAVGVGVPVVLATVRGRTVLAEDTTEMGSGCGSMHNSGWLNRENSVERYAECVEKGYIDENGNYIPPSEQTTEPLIDLTPEPEADEVTKGGNGWGKGGKPK